MHQFSSACLSILCSLAISIAGCQSPAQESEAIRSVVIGKVYLAGNEPFTELVLEAAGEEVLTLRGNLVSDLRALQGQRVQVQGTIINNQDFLYSSKGLLVEAYSQQPFSGDN